MDAVCVAVQAIYVWRITSGSPTGSGSGDTWTGQAASGHYSIGVTVTDATGRVAAGGHSVFITSAAPDC